MVYFGVHRLKNHLAGEGDGGSARITNNMVKLKGSVSDPGSATGLHVVDSAQILDFPSI